jgi:hypothetical protein
MPQKSHASEDTKSSHRPRFGLQAMLWTFLVMGMTLAYLRRLQSPAVFLEGSVVLATAAIVGAAIGWWPRRVADATYWSVVISTAAFLSVVGERSQGPMFAISWSAVGIMTGACCSLITDSRLLLRMFTGCLVAGITMLVCSATLLPATLRAGSIELLFDLASAPVVGALVGLLIEIILWLERKSYAPRYITASWLLCAVIMGNLLVPSWALS